MWKSVETWEFVFAVTRPALIVAPASFLDDIRANLAKFDIQDAVARCETAPIFDWLIGLTQFQGISDANALAYVEKHGLLRFAEIEVGLARQRSCPRLRSH